MTINFHWDQVFLWILSIATVVAYLGVRIWYLSSGESGRLQDGVSIPYSWMVLLAEGALSTLGIYLHQNFWKQNVKFEEMPPAAMEQINKVRTTLHTTSHCTCEPPCIAGQRASMHDSEDIHASDLVGEVVCSLLRTRRPPFHCKLPKACGMCAAYYIVLVPARQRALLDHQPLARRCTAAAAAAGCLFTVAGRRQSITRQMVHERVLFVCIRGMHAEW